MKQRIYTLDICKIVLTVLVVFHHFQQITGVVYEGVNFYGGTIDMYPILELFFMISGFMCAPAIGKMLDESFGKYFIKKAIRIYPMVAITMITGAIIMFSYFRMTGTWFFDIAVTYWRTFSSMLLLTTGGPINNGLSLNPPLWYLCVLIYCYVLLYFIVWLCKKLQVNHLVGAGVMVIVGSCVVEYGVAFPFFTEETGRGYSAFFLGIIIYSMWEKLSHKALTIYGFAMTALCAFGYLFKFEYIQGNHRAVMAYMLWPALMFVSLSTARFFHLKIWSILAAISFEVYIWHFIGLAFLMFISVKFGLVFPNPMHLMVEFLLVLWVFAAVVYYLVEKPLTKWLKGLIQNG